MKEVLVAVAFAPIAIGSVYLSYKFTVRRVRELLWWLRR